jgi:hypothetical protein
VEKICVWPDYTWCYEEDLEEYSHLSDDFMLLEIPEELEDDEEIDAWLERTRPQG